MHKVLKIRQIWSHWVCITLSISFKIRTKSFRPKNIFFIKIDASKKGGVVIGVAKEFQIFFTKAKLINSFIRWVINKNSRGRLTDWMTGCNDDERNEARLYRLIFWGFLVQTDRMMQSN